MLETFGFFDLAITPSKRLSISFRVNIISPIFFLRSVTSAGAIPENVFLKRFARSI